jgi:predicted RNA-binding Zn-ribbon protein involved in translation (DUF1610 family)
MSKSKGPWITRFSIRLFTVVFGILIFWLLGFLVEDIESIQGPQYEPIEARHLDRTLIANETAQDKKIEELTRQIDNLKASQELIGASSQNLQQTINQLLELQKLGIEKNIAFSDKEQANVTSSLNLFLENQKKYQELNQQLSLLLRQKQDLETEKQSLQNQIENQRKPAREEFERLSEKHRLKLAFLQLAVLLPLLGVAAFLFIRKRSGIYYPLYLAFGCATLLKIGFVIHEYFPSKYIKYVLIIALLLAVGWMLVYFIRTIAFPKVQWLLKQYREAYEIFLCPVCEYPIRSGPRRFLFWTRRSIKKLAVPAEPGNQEEPYTCPSCGTILFEGCPSCNKIRHALLPHCSHCGVEKTIAAARGIGKG